MPAKGLESLETEKYDEETRALPRGSFHFVGTRRQALPRLFYPGVSDIARAAVIVIADKESESQEYDFHLPLPE